MIWELAVRLDRKRAEDLAEFLRGRPCAGVVVEWHPEGDQAVVKGYFDPGHDRLGTELALWLWLAAAGFVATQEWRSLADQDWAEAWQRHIQPLPVGRSLLVLPTWLSPGDYDARQVLRLDPGMAFGTGSHESTRGALEALEKRCETASLGRVLDWGTGSGILAIAAALWGAREVVATDNDPLAVAACGKNCRLNGVHSVVTVHQTGELPQGPFHTVLANILAPILIEKGAVVAGILDRGGCVILSGILLDQVDAVALAYERAGLAGLDVHRLGEWAILSLFKGKG